MGRPTKEHRAFQDFTDRLFTVPKETVDKRIAAENAKKAAKPRSMRQGRKPKLPEGRDSRK